ncbi:TPA: hypothetical protein N0F65_004247 [Lagenidium giganteum]|uniref:Amino acid transporter n=1 Tax=Lagenidium giganteum TaxID=4803 RepID=A0AAV2ZGH6_9STRA|nr:TPA: hypothetical protein N0F65_004247 [Lagenidium giganteum]
MAPAKRPGIILYNDPYGSERDFEEVLTPMEPIVSPAAYVPDGKHYAPVKHPGQSSISGGTRSGYGFEAHTLGGAFPDDDYEEASCIKRMLGSTLAQVLVGVVCGVAVGAIMSSTKASADVNELVSLPGKVFLRLLKLLVIPMVFACLTTGVVTIVQLGKVSAVGSRTVLYFIGMSTICAMLSLTVAMTLRSLQPHREFAPTKKPHASMHFMCSNNKYAQLVNDSAVSCNADAAGNMTQLELIDITGAVVRGAVAKVAVSDQITGIINSIIPNNIMDTFQQGVLMGVISFSLAFGTAAIQSAEADNSILLVVLTQFNSVFYFMITRLIDWSPLAVFSLVASSLGSQGSMISAIKHVGVLILCQIINFVTLQLVIYPCLLWLSTRKNPFDYMRQMLPCVAFAFGCASSLATLPVTLRCVESTREVSRSLLQFVVTIGCTVHMNGTAMMFPNTVVFLASTSSTDIEIGWVQMAIIVVVAVLGSIGVAPIPNAGLVMIFSVWSTAFPNDEFPTSFSYIVAIYWYIDRVNTFNNVVGDTYIARIIAEQVDETYETAMR